MKRTNDNKYWKTEKASKHCHLGGKPIHLVLARACEVMLLFPRLKLFPRSKQVQFNVVVFTRCCETYAKLANTCKMVQVCAETSWGR